MARTIHAISVVIVLLFSGGCVVVQDLPYDPKTDRWVDDRLIGTWHCNDPETGEPRIVEIQRCEQRSYAVAARDAARGASSEDGCVVDLVRIGGDTYMFERPANYAPLASDKAGYQFFKVTIEQQRVRLAVPVPAEWRGMIAKDPRVLSVRDGADAPCIVITATPAQVQTFVIRNQKNQKLFSEFAMLHRVSAK